MSYLSMELVGHRMVAPVQRDDAPLAVGEVRIRVEAASLCPTDVKKWDDAALPARLAALAEAEAEASVKARGLVLGHEFAGVVIETHESVTDVLVGDRVTVDPVLRCGACRWCADGHPEYCVELLGIGAAAGDPVACVVAGLGGGFAEHVVVPARNVIPLPDELSFADGALVEPLADVVHALEAARLRPGDVTAVVGLGPMGVLHVEALLFAGHRVIGVDPREDRRAVVEALGATAVVPHELPAVDAVFITAGGGAHVPATEHALERLAPGGRVVLFSSGAKGVALTVDSNRMHYRRQTLTGVVGFDRRHAVEAMRILASGGISVELVRQPSLPLARLGEAFAGVLDPGVLKTAILFGDSALEESATAPVAAEKAEAA
ncbi:alcohol dehydrogenase catalytic domain-containing protein [Herbiconiux moechotypicola]|uniref:(R,R)-butanediol dehydrogenase n=1 Tax=Herbiconiux moechotypicola TaxID=637393 RepID=A0ABN3D8P4_9MICO|nr:alcohol dehydrogenase catalytic domain-containing protein [Herbiconiux moechotypicola]MCS5728201.1 alcohol dehydrogenase catalytic domain-containing protein [Herbiconiux moechotypicola]